MIDPEKYALDMQDCYQSFTKTKDNLSVDLINNIKSWSILPSKTKTWLTSWIYKCILLYFIFKECTKPKIQSSFNSDYIQIS